jgi:hypothetical protein
VTQNANTKPQSLIVGLFHSRLVFCTVVAVLMLIARYISFDKDIWNLVYYPNHDMSQGLTFFTTSLHSIRLSGDLAWWNPLSTNGFAQYYSAFFSPLAPTWGNIVFILWMQVNQVFHFPEYLQYLWINYLVFPFLSFFCLSLFLTFLFKQRLVIIFILLINTLSGIGAWNSAWFYFQESFTLFLLLAAIVAALQQPTPRRLLFLLCAGLIQMTSLNY